MGLEAVKPRIPLSIGIVEVILCWGDYLRKKNVKMG
jgi:hypothetical protein